MTNIDKKQASHNVLDLIGNTPLVTLDRMVVAAGLNPQQVRICAKCEFRNPGASIKDRPAKAIVERALAAGELKPGQDVIELTSGNFGTGMAIVCGALGHPFTAVMSRGNTPERARMMRALGATVELVDQAPDSVPMQVSGEDLKLVEARTVELAESRGAFRADQFRDPGNPSAHEITGREIINQSGGQVTHFACNIGSAGSFTGIARTLKEKNAKVECWALEPNSARVLAGQAVTNQSHVIQGTGYSMIPPFWQPGLANGFLGIADTEAVETTRNLARLEGLFVGISSGANVAGALQLARKAPTGSTIVTLLCDAGLKYLSTDVFV